MKDIFFNSIDTICIYGMDFAEWLSEKFFQVHHWAVCKTAKYPF